MIRLPLTQGITSGYRWPITQGGVAADLTSWSAKCQVRASESPSAKKLFEFSTQIVDSAVVISWTAAESLNWKFTQGYFDVVLVDPDGVPRYIVVEGQCFVNRVVSHAD